MAKRSQSDFRIDTWGYSRTAEVITPKLEPRYHSTANLLLVGALFGDEVYVAVVGPFEEVGAGAALLRESSRLPPVLG